MRWIDAMDLKNWSPSRDSEEYLPLVIRRLIRATIDQISSISFPAGDSIVCPGWDGRLESMEETEYIPSGLSLWEISTRKDIKTKAEEDYQKRKEKPLVTNPSEATFIFVTSRLWTKKSEWAEEKKKEKFWKDVRVYDATDLEEWLDQVPAVGIWLAKHIGKYPQQNVQSLEDWWNEWSQITRPPLTAELVLAGRKEQVEEVKKWLNSEPSILKVQSLTKDEALAFLSGVILTLPEGEKEYFLSKAVVISNLDAFRHITTTCKNRLLLIPTFEEGIENVASQHNHFILIPLSPDNTVTKDKILLPRPERDEFVSALEKMGINEEDAEKLSRDTARSLTGLRRRLSPVSMQPEWAKPEEVREILPALLVGKWDERKEGDKEVITEISGFQYPEFIGNLKKWLYQPDPPILKVGEIWRLTSPLDAFFALSPFLTGNDFGKLRETSLKVLREIDPSLDLEPEKRWMASLYGKEAKYSKTLREGVVQTLVLIAVFGDKLNLDISYSHTPQIWVDGVVHGLLNNADWKLWHSISDVLPLIAEASPSSFLDAVEDSLSKESPPIMGMFSETDDTLTSHSAHPSLLWALEGLAWDPNLLGRVTLILGKLAMLDPGGKLANRPISSLRTIFLLWLPHTFATLEQRLKTLDMLIEREPEIGWELLISLMPRSHDSCSPTHKPRWRLFSDKTSHRVIAKEYIESISGIVDKILANVGRDGKKWAEIMEHYSDLPPQEREKVIKELSNSISYIENGKNDLWNKLREILSRHRSFPDAKWALPEEELKQIEEIYNKLEPHDTIKRHLWLFDNHWPNLPEGKERGDYKKSEQIVTQRRIEIIRDIKDELGMKGLTKVAEESKNPQIVGSITAELTLTEDEEGFLFSLLDTEDNQTAFVQGYIWRKAFISGNVWIEKVVDTALEYQWPLEKVINLFIALPQNKEVWNLLEKFNPQIQEEYWKKIQPRLFDLSVEEKVYTLEKLMSVKRHFIALDTAAMFAKELPSKLITDLLKKAALEKSIDDFQIVDPWDIEELFRILDESKEIEKEEIAKLEWLYLTILARVGSGRPPKMLHQELSTNTEFFAELVRYVYKPRNEIDNEEEDLPQELIKQRARLAWQLLNTWKTVPGSDRSGRIDYQKLKSWTEKARKLCRDTDRLEVCDIHIGQVLAHASSDENGKWPPEEVCRIIDEIQSKKLESGFSTGTYNKRGLVTKSSFEGGKQERELAEKYRKYADKWVIQFPRTAAVLRKIAENYELEAKREDEEAEKRRLEW